MCYRTVDFHAHLTPHPCTSDCVFRIPRGLYQAIADREYQGDCTDQKTFALVRRVSLNTEGALSLRQVVLLPLRRPIGWAFIASSGGCVGDLTFAGPVTTTLARAHSSVETEMGIDPDCSISMLLRAKAKTFEDSHLGRGCYGVSCLWRPLN